VTPVDRLFAATSGLEVVVWIDSMPHYRFLVQWGLKPGFCAAFDQAYRWIQRLGSLESVTWSDAFLLHWGDVVHSDEADLMERVRLNGLRMNLARVPVYAKACAFRSICHDEDSPIKA
jgi:hypothetical protein